MAKAKETKAEKVVDESGENIRGYPNRKGYAERIKKKKVKSDASDDAPKSQGIESGV